MNRRFSGVRVFDRTATLKVDRDAVEWWLQYFGYPTMPVVTLTGERWKDGARKLKEGDDDDDDE